MLSLGLSSRRGEQQNEQPCDQSSPEMEIRTGSSSQKKGMSNSMKGECILGR